MNTNAYPNCRKCQKQTSKVGNYTNMYLAGIRDPKVFDKQYGMMCGDHAAEVTKMIIREKNLTQEDFADSHMKTLRLLDEELLGNKKA